MHEWSISSRRQFLKVGAAGAAGAVLPGWATTKGAPAIVTAQIERPLALQGLTLGDPGNGSIVVWSRSDRPARMLVEWAYDEAFAEARRIVGPHALETTDFTARQGLKGLEAGSEVFVRVLVSEPEERSGAERAGDRAVRGAARATARRRACVRTRFSAICASSGAATPPGRAGASIPASAGMKIYEAMRQRKPLFFIHSGDTIYADGPIAESVAAEGGVVWNNLVTPEVSKVAETLDEFRGRYRYNLLDENVRRFNAEVPQIWQWDDHEVTNNWSDAKDLSADARYSEKNVPLLIARGTRAFLDYAAMRPFSMRESRARLSALQLRSATRSVRARHAFVPRARTPPICRLRPGPQTVFLGREQLDWLKKRPRRIARGVEGHRCGHAARPEHRRRHARPRDCRAGKRSPTAIPAAPKGRELEFVELLGFLKRRPGAERRVAHRRRPLLRRALLQSGQRRLPRLRRLLGIRRRSAQRRHLRSEHARRHIRPAGSSSSRRRRQDNRTCRH